jgi:hypothetical protein
LFLIFGNKRNERKSLSCLFILVIVMLLSVLPAGAGAEPPERSRVPASVIQPSGSPAGEYVRGELIINSTGSGIVTATFPATTSDSGASFSRVSPRLATDLREGTAQKHRTLKRRPQQVASSENSAMAMSTQTLMDVLAVMAMSTQSFMAAVQEIKFTGSIFGRQYEVFTSPVQGFPLHGNSFVVLSTGVAGEAAGQAQTFASTDMWGVFQKGYSPHGYDAFDIAKFSIRLKIPENANTLSFQYRFATEESPSFIDSQYRDYFRAMLEIPHRHACRLFKLLPDGRFHVAVDNARPFYNIPQGSSVNPLPPFPEPNDTAYNSVTSLQKVEIDVSGDRGREVILHLEIADASDAIYDTAVLLDNFDFTFESTQIIESAIAWGKARLGWTDWEGKCYVFVREAFWQAGVSKEMLPKAGAIDPQKPWAVSVAKWFHDRGQLRMDQAPPRGALVFYGGNFRTAARVWHEGHVGISLGDGQIVHAFGPVRIDDYLNISGVLDHDFMGWTTAHLGQQAEAHPGQPVLQPIARADDIVLDTHIRILDYAGIRNATTLKELNDAINSIAEMSREDLETLIREVSLEDYVKGVVQKETSPDHMKDTVMLALGRSPGELTKEELMELLKAQSVAARTFAVSAVNGRWTRGNNIADRWNASRPKNDRIIINITNSQWDQVWKDGPYDQRVVDAVTATRGQVVSYGQWKDGNFHSFNDQVKKDEDKKGVWGGAILAAFSSYGNKRGDLNMFPFNETLTPRQAGWTRNWSYLPQVDSHIGVITKPIANHPLGHGVGMTQYGATNLAARGWEIGTPPKITNQPERKVANPIGQGWNYLEILQHYYPGTDVVYTDRIASQVKRFAIASAASLQVYDSAGRVTGVVYGVIKAEIPGSSYNPLAHTVTIAPSLDNYRVVVEGYETGTYSLSLMSYDEGKTDFIEVKNVAVAPGKTHKYRVDWEAIALGEKGITITIGDTSFTTSTPYIPSNPLPQDMATIVPRDVYLAWEGGDKADSDKEITYELFLGTSPSPPLVAALGPFLATQLNISYKPDRLDSATTYFWRVVARDSYGVIAEGPVWQFTTEVCAAINPEEARFDLRNPDDVSTNITWNDASVVTAVYYKVYEPYEKVYELNRDVHYTVSDTVYGKAKLTIRNNYISGLRPTVNEQLAFIINFDVGDPANFAVEVLETVSAAVPAPPATVAPAPPAPALPAQAPVATGVERSVTIDGTTVIELDGVVRVTIPAGAVIGPAPKIVARILPTADASSLLQKATGVGLTAASEVVVLTMTGGEFTAPVQLTLNFDTAKVATGQVPAVFVYNERTGRWIYLGGQAGDSTITVTVSRFSRFAVFATKPLPALADIADHWGRGSIRTLAGMGIVSGYAEGNFNPGAAVTRAEFASMLTRALGLEAKPEAAARFTDPAGWAQGAIGAAAEAGLLAGYADGTFGGARRITRAEMAVILERVIRKRLVPVGWTAGADFADAKALPAWAADGIRTASSAGLVRGFQDKTFRPGSATSRAEAAAALYRLVAGL